MIEIKQQPYWTIEDALALIRSHQLNLHKFGFHIALAGGVLNNGESNNDLDLIIIPMNLEEDNNEEEMIKYLNINIGELQIPSSDEYKLSEFYTLYKTIYQEKDIDIFILG